MTQEMKRILEKLAPGKPLREGIDLIISAELGGLLFLTDNFEEYLKRNIIQIGFVVNTEYAPEKLYELSKMDGAIVLNKDANRIIYANVHLLPNPDIPSTQTGMRHRAAERLAIQTNEPVIAISKRRNTISVFLGDEKHVVLPESIIFARFSREISIAYRYKQAFSDKLSEVNEAEKEDRVTLLMIAETISKGLIALNIAKKSENYLIQLGDVAGSAKLELMEIFESLPKLLGAIILDYSKEDLQEIQKPEEAINIFKGIKEEDMMNFRKIVKILGYEVVSEDEMEDTIIYPRGYRLLYSTRIPSSKVKDVVMKFGTLKNLLSANEEDLLDIPGIGKKRADMIMRTIRRRKFEEESLEGKYEGSGNQQASL